MSVSVYFSNHSINVYINKHVHTHMQAYAHTHTHTYINMVSLLSGHIFS